MTSSLSVFSTEIKNIFDASLKNEEDKVVRFSSEISEYTSMAHTLKEDKSESNVGTGVAMMKR